MINPFLQQLRERVKLREAASEYVFQSERQREIFHKLYTIRYVFCEKDLGIKSYSDPDFEIAMNKIKEMGFKSEVSCSSNWSNERIFLNFDLEFGRDMMLLKIYERVINE